MANIQLGHTLELERMAGAGGVHAIATAGVGEHEKETEDSDEKSGAGHESSSSPSGEQGYDANDDGVDHSLDGKVDPNAQEGVQGVEAITLSWSKRSLYTAYACMFLLYFTNAFQSSITSSLSAFIVSGFASHSLIPVIGVVSSVMSAATYLPVAKLMNLWDRGIGFAFMATVATLGLILSATCTNIYTYCASQVFYAVGFSGMIFAVDVITADTSTLRNRGLAYAFTSSPYIITAFAGPKASEGFYEDNWRWGFGTFAIVLPIVAAPLFFTLQYNKKKAQRNGLLVRPKSGRTLLQSVWHYVIEFDALGILLLAGGLVLFLLPFTIAASAADQWASPHIIAMLVVGFVLLIAFVLVERFVSPTPFIPYRLLTDRTILGACLLDFTYQISYYCWGSYFTSFLMVNYGVSISVAGYISNIFDVVAGVGLFFVGYLIRRTGYFRWILMIAVPLYILFLGLMIKFREPHEGVGWIVMCQIFLAISGGTMIDIQQVAVLAAASHNDAAAVLALLGVFGSCGDAAGNSISGAVWTHTLPEALQRLLPADTVADWEDIYDDLDVQLSYPIGDPTREAIMYSYAYAQKYMLIAGTGIMVLSFAWVMMMKNINVTKIEQVRGTLF